VIPVADPFIDEEQRRMLPAPGWSEATEPYWRAAGKGQLLVQQCTSCHAHRWPLSEGCYNCTATTWEWAEVPGTGMVFSFTWADFPPTPDGKDRNISVIELDGTTGPDAVRVGGWVVDIEREQLVCDLPVEVTFVKVDDEVSVPAWKPRT
jgi:uncharacterized OB-fold protein